jgi:hypothetical protein
MRDDSKTATFADQLQSTAAALARDGEELSSINKLLGDRIRVAIDALPLHAQTVMAASHKLIAGLRGISAARD